MKVDILIPSKDRPAQLHQLLSLINDNVEGIGKITITIQASDPEYKKGYEILQERLENDGNFALLRKNTEIALMFRSSLKEIVKALDCLGDSKLLLVLTDDEVFFGKIDFENNSAINRFLIEKDILSCSLRLGKNITPEVPDTHSYFTRPQPNFIEQANDYLVWSWPDNLDTYHWACIFSTTGHIYRKDEYIEWFNLFGKDNFLRIEGSALKYMVNRSFIVSYFILNMMEYADMVVEKLLRMFIVINYQPVFFNTLVKYLYKAKIFSRKNPRIKMISLSQSVTATLDINTSQKWRGVKGNFIANNLINSKYLDGYIISKDLIPALDFNEPNLRGKSIVLKFVKYSLV